MLEVAEFQDKLSQLSFSSDFDDADIELLDKGYGSKFSSTIFFYLVEFLQLLLNNII